MTRWVRPLSWAVIGVSTAAAMVVYVRHNAGFAVDDSYITFRYAENLATGNGLVFNVDERYYGSTAAGYALLLGLLRGAALAVGADFTVPALSTWLSAAGIAAFTVSLAALVMQTAGRRWPVPAAAVGIAAGWWIFLLPGASSVAGHETYAFVGLLALGVTAALLLARPVVGGLLLALAVAVRPDGLLMGGLVCLALLVMAVVGRIRWRAAVLGIGSFAALTGAWLVGMRLYYGTWLPGTMDAKRAQVAFGYWPVFDADTAAAQIDGFFGGTSWRWLAVLAIVGAGVAVVALVADGLAWRAGGSPRAEPGDHPPSVGVALMALVWCGFAVGSGAAYMAFGVTIWPWYALPIAFAVIAAATASACLVVSGARLLRPTAARAGYAVVAGALVLAAVVPSVPAVADRWPVVAGSAQVNPHLVAYDEVAAAIRGLAPGGTSVAIAEPGTFGFRLGPTYRIVDTLGLATPGVAKALLAGDRDYPVRELAPEFVVVSWDGAYNPDQQAGFRDRYRRIAEIPSAYFAAGGVRHGIFIYRRR